MLTFKKLARWAAASAAAAALFLSASPASADPVTVAFTWYGNGTSSDAGTYSLGSSNSAGFSYSDSSIYTLLGYTADNFTSIIISALSGLSNGGTLNIYASSSNPIGNLTGTGVTDYTVTAPLSGSMSFQLPVDTHYLAFVSSASASAIFTLSGAAAVPEASTLAAMLTGLALLGFAGWRAGRRRGANGYEGLASA